MFQRTLTALLSIVLVATVAPQGQALSAPAEAESASTAPSQGVSRISGPDRYSVAEAVAKKWSGPVSVANVVSGQKFPDALSAGALAGGADAPVVLVRPDSIPSATRAALAHLSPKKIVIVGGPATVSASMERALKPFASSGVVERVGGRNRYAVSAGLFDDAPSRPKRVYLVSGEDFPDALAASALAGHDGAPLLLTRKSSLDPTVVTRLKELDAGEVVVIGDRNAVSDAVAHTAASHSSRGTFKRIAGGSASETSALIAREFGPTPTRAYVASSQVYPDGLVGSALAAKEGAPILLTPGSKIDKHITGTLGQLGIGDVHVLGGEATVSGAAMRELEDFVADTAASCDQPLPHGTQFGAGVSTAGQTADQAVAALDSAFGRVPILRSFSSGMPHPWTSRQGRALEGRDVVSSFKAQPKSILSGEHDATLEAWFRGAPEDQVVYWSYFHEPESEINKGQFTASDYRAAWRHIKTLEEKTCNPNLYSTLILTEWTASPSSGRKLSTYDAGPDVVDLLSFDPYNGVYDNTRSYYVAPSVLLDHVVSFAEEGNRPFAVAEIGSRLIPGDSGSGRAKWLREIGDYLIAHDAVFVTYFQVEMTVNWRLDDVPSRQAWRQLVSGNPHR